MSELHTSLVQQEMEENGEMDFIRQHVKDALGTPDASETTPAEAETVTEEAAEEVDSESSTEEEVPADDGTEAEAESEDDVLWLELDDETQALLDNKYGGDLSKMLNSLPDAQSAIGRQGNEMGALRAELAAIRAEIQQGLQAAQPMPEWPDEFADTSERAAAFHEIAEAAFERRDPQTFDRALKAWQETDPVSAGLYRNLKEMHVQQIMAAEQAPETGVTLDEAVAGVISEIPQFQVESFQAEVAAELDKTPSLKAVLWNGVPGVTVEERATILREAAQRVLARTTSETATAARRRIAVRTSEEARAARVQAQVARGGTAREEEIEKERRTVPMGTTGQVLDIDRLNAMLPEEDRL